jgi:hypothetical protein
VCGASAVMKYILSTDPRDVAEDEEECALPGRFCRFRPPGDLGLVLTFQGVLLGWGRALGGGDRGLDVGGILFNMYAAPSVTGKNSWTNVSMEEAEDGADTDSFSSPPFLRSPVLDLERRPDRWRCWGCCCCCCWEWWWWW